MEYPQPSASTSAADPIAPPHPMPVVGPQYCCPHPVDLAIVRNVVNLADKFTVTDINGNVLFKLQADVLTLHSHRVLLDAAENSVITLRRKLMTAHDRWEAFRGNSSNLNDLIFSLKRPSVVQFEPKFDVFLASNTSEQVCDFKIKGSQDGGSCVVYAGESDIIVAQMHQKLTVRSTLFGKTNFMVTVSHNVDYAFIVALILILDRKHKDIKNIKGIKNFGKAASSAYRILK